MKPTPIQPQHMGFFIICILLLLFGTGCYDGESSKQPDTGGSSSVFFNIQWNMEKQPSDRWKSASEPIVCNDIAAISASIFEDSSQSNELQSGGPWACEDQEATIDHIPSGYHAYARIYATDVNGEIIYAGDSNQFYLEPDKTVNAGSIGASSFVPEGLSYAPQGSQTLIRFNGVEIASKYRIELSESETFATTLSYEMSSTGSDIETYQINTDLLPNSESGVCYFRVTAMDYHGAVGKSSQPSRIDIKSSDPFRFSFNWNGAGLCHSESSWDIVAVLYNQNNDILHRFTPQECNPEFYEFEAMISEANREDEVHLVFFVGYNQAGRAPFEIHYRGESPPVYISSIETTNLGSINAASFIPDPVSPNENAIFYNTDPINFSWNAVNGAAYYELIIYGITETYFEIFRKRSNSEAAVRLETADILSILDNGFSEFGWTIQAIDETDPEHKSAISPNLSRRFSFRFPTYGTISLTCDPVTPHPAAPPAIEVSVCDQETFESIHLSQVEYTKTHAAISELPPGITAKAVLYEKAVQENRNFLIHRRDKCQSILLETDPIKVVREIAGKGDTLDSKKIDNIISNFGTNFLFKEGGWRPV